jgi:hypothetical protein
LLSRKAFYELAKQNAGPARNHPESSPASPGPR